MGIAVVRRNPGFLEQLAMTVLPGLMGSMIEQGQERSRNASVVDAFAAMYPNTQPEETPTPDIKFDSQYASMSPDTVAQEEPMIYKALGNLFSQQGTPSAQPGWDNVQQEVTRQNASDKMGALLQDPAFRKGVTNAGPGLLEKALAMYQGQDQAHSQGLQQQYVDSLIGNTDFSNQQEAAKNVMRILQRTDAPVGKEMVNALQHFLPHLDGETHDLGGSKVQTNRNPWTGEIREGWSGTVTPDPNNIGDWNTSRDVANINAWARKYASDKSLEAAQLKAAGSPQDSSPANLPTTVVPFVRKVIEGLGTPIITRERVAQSFGETPLGRELSESDPAKYDTQVASRFQTQLEDRRQQLVAQKVFLSDYSQHPDVKILLGQIDEQISTLDEMLKDSTKEVPKAASDAQLTPEQEAAAQAFTKKWRF